MTIKNNSVDDLLPIKSKDDLYRFKLLTGGDVSDPNAYVRTIEKKYSLCRLFFWIFFSIGFCFLSYFKFILFKFYRVSAFFIFLYFMCAFFYGVFCLGKGYANFWMDHSKNRYTTRIISEPHARKSNFLLIDSFGSGFFLLVFFVYQLIGG